MSSSMYDEKNFKKETKNNLLIITEIIKSFYVLISCAVAICIPNSDMDIKSTCLTFELLLFGILCDYIESAVINYTKLKEIRNPIDEGIKQNIENLPKDKQILIKKLLDKTIWIPYKTIRDIVLADDELYLKEKRPEIKKYNMTRWILVVGLFIISINIVYFLILHFFNQDSTLYIKMESCYETIINIPWTYCFFYICKVYNDSGLGNFINSKKSKNYFKKM